MAIVKDFYNAVDRWAPFAIQEGFDNAGFLVGRADAAVTRVLVALDITLPVIEEAEKLGVQLIVSHHPVIFSPLKSVTDGDYNGHRVLALAEKKIAAICAHTNLDAAQGGVNCCLARRLGLTDIGQLHAEGTDEQGREYGIGRIGTAHREGLTAEEYARFVKEQLGASSVRFADSGKPVEKVAVGGGSCASMMMDAIAAGCDTFVTADVKYDQYLQAKSLGLTLMDAGHFATENVITAPMAEYLAKEFPEVEIFVSDCHREVYAGV